MPKGTPNPPLSVELIERLSERAPGGCLLWTGPVGKTGYARWKYKGEWIYVYRWLYAYVHGEEAVAGLTVDHQCHDPAECQERGQCPHRRCVEITHLLAMTRAENTMRGGSPLSWKSRQTACVHGHPLSGENLYVTPDGRRQCRRCRAGNQKRWEGRKADDSA